MPIRMGLWGAGTVAKEFARAVQNNSGVELIGVASRSFSHAQETAKELGLKAYPSYDDMLLDSNINFIYVSSPTRSHYDDMKKIINARKNIICEKPFTESREEAEVIFNLADQFGLIVLDGLWSMYMPLFDFLYSNSVHMGRLLFASASLGWPSLNKRGNSFSSKYELWDYEIYPVAIMTRLFGVPKNINSKTKNIGDLAYENISYFHFCNGGIGRVHSSLKHRSSYVFIAVYSKGIVFSRKWWLGDQKVIVFKNFFLPKVKDFYHKVNGYEYEVNELEQRYTSGCIAKMPREHTLTILESLDMVKNNGIIQKR